MDALGAFLVVAAIAFWFSIGNKLANKLQTVDNSIR